MQQSTTMIYSHGIYTAIIYPYQYYMNTLQSVIKRSYTFVVHNTMFSLCWLLTLLCHVLNEQGVLLAHVSSIVAGSLLLPFQAIRLGWALLGSLPPHTFPQASFLYSGSRQSPQTLLGTAKIEQLEMLGCEDSEDVFKIDLQCLWKK